MYERRIAIKNKIRNIILGSILLAIMCSCDDGISAILPSTSTSASSTSENISKPSISPSNNTPSNSASTDLSHEGYYKDVDNSKQGNDLLNELRKLNNTKRKKTVGYKKLGDYYLQTDGDPDNPSNVICFYSGASVKFSGSFSGSVNREHVWPNSRGGSAVEGDLHMTRPTLSSENGSRGNAFFVEGGKSGSTGWDPAMESFGKEYYRGITARIIFYCTIASSSLTLIDKNNDSASNKTMGKLSDLLEWNYKYDIDATEIRRNEAVMGIQGNRNPFIDDRSYAFRVFKNYSSDTKQVCSKYGY